MLHMSTNDAHAIRQMHRRAALARRCRRQVKGHGFSPHNGIQIENYTLKCDPFVQTEAYGSDLPRTCHL